MENRAYRDFIPAAELEFYLMSDPAYGVEGEWAEHICQLLLDGGCDNQRLVELIIGKFELMPCKSNRQKLLVFLWCAATGLPAYRSGERLDWRWDEYLSDWKSMDFVIRLKDLEDLLGRNTWPLPVWYFPPKSERVGDLIKNEPKTRKNTLKELVYQYMDGYLRGNGFLPNLNTVLNHLRSVSFEDGGDSTVIMEVRDSEIIWKSHTGSERCMKISSFKTFLSKLKGEFREIA